MFGTTKSRPLCLDPVTAWEADGSPEYCAENEMHKMTKDTNYTKIVIKIFLQYSCCIVTYDSLVNTFK